MANSEVSLKDTIVEPGFRALTGQAVLDHAQMQDNISHIGQTADALARDWLQSGGASDLSPATKAKTLLGAAAEGTLQNGLDEIYNHPGRAAAEVLGAVAVGLALRGPVWARIPAIAFAVAGTAAYGQHVTETGIQTTSIMKRMNSRNLEESRQELKDTLGPVIFETALMYASGHLSANMAAKLPAEFSQVKLASTFSLATDHLNSLLGWDGDGFPHGMTPAYASTCTGGRPLAFPIERIMPRPNLPASDNILQMSTSDGGAGRQSSISGDGISFKTGRGPQGERFYNIDHVPPGRTVNIRHDGSVITTVGSNGKVTVGFSSGEGRTLDLGQEIKRIVMSEYANGLKQFRFNSKIASDLEVDNNGHTIRALLGNGDHLHMLDNIKDGYMHFPHKDGSQTWVEHRGRVLMQLPGNAKIYEVSLPDKLAYIRLLEKVDGGKELRFLNDIGQPVAQTIQLPPIPELQQMQAPDEVQNWHNLRNYIASKTSARQNPHNNAYDDAISGGGGVYRVEPSPGGVLHPQHSANFGGPGALRLPRSYDRLMARELAGVPLHIMRGNDLSVTADMELAMQGHSWVVTNYLDRLDTQDTVHHQDW